MGLPRIMVLISSALLIGAPALAQLPPAYLGSWGGSGSGAGQFSAPYGVAIGPDGRAYVLDSGNERVEMFTAAGDYLSQWSRDPSADGSGYPEAIAVAPGGDVYILTGPYPGLIHHYSAAGVLLGAEQSVQEGNVFAYGIAPSPGGCILEPVTYSNPVPPVYYSSYVRSFSQCAQTWGGSVGTGPGQFSADLRGIAVDATGDIYVVDYGNKRIEKFNANAVFLTQWGSAGAGDGQFTYPFGIAVGPNGHVYVTDVGSNRIQEFDAQGTFLSKWGSSGSGPGLFSVPLGIAVDAVGDIYIADTGNNRIQKFGSGAVPTMRTSWGHIKAAYR